MFHLCHATSSSNYPALTRSQLSFFFFFSSFFQDNNLRQEAYPLDEAQKTVTSAMLMFPSIFIQQEELYAQV